MKTIEISWKDLTKEKQQEMIDEYGFELNDFDLVATVDIEEEE